MGNVKRAVENVGKEGLLGGGVEKWC